MRIQLKLFFDSVLRYKSIMGLQSRLVRSPHPVRPGFVFHFRPNQRHIHLRARECHIKNPIILLQFALFPALAAILFTDLFDSLSTFVGVAHATGLVDEEGHPQRLSQGLVVDALATVSAALFGTSSGTAFIESAAGIEAGGRSGRASVVTAACFVPCLFFAPVAGMVPPFATAPVLILVGALMFRSVGQLDLSKIEDTIPAFLTIVLIPLTFSITEGMLWGFVTHVVRYVLAGRRGEIRPAMFGIAGVSVALLVMQART